MQVQRLGAVAEIKELDDARYINANHLLAGCYAGAELLVSPSEERTRIPYTHIDESGVVKEWQRRPTNGVWRNQACLWGAGRGAQFGR